MKTRAFLFVLGLILPTLSFSQKFYFGANLSAYSNHFRYENSPNRFQPAYSRFAVFPNSGVNVGYKLDLRNSLQLNFSFLPYNMNESPDGGSKFPTSQYTLIPVSTNINLKYLRKVFEFPMFKKPLIFNVTAGTVIQFNARGDEREIHDWPKSGDSYMQSRSSATFLLGQLGIETEWRLRNYSLIAGYNWFLGSNAQTTSKYYFDQNGTQATGVRYGDGFGMNFYLGVRFYPFKSKSN